MTTKKRAPIGKGKVRPLKLKKETVRDLDVRGKARGIKGGMIPNTKVGCGGSEGRRTCGVAGC